MTIRVILVDDNAGIRENMVNWLRGVSEIELIGVSGDGGKALTLASELAPDVLILDVELPGMGGDEVATHLKEIDSPVKTLLISAYSDPYFVNELLKSGAAGYLVKDEAWKCLVDTIRRVAGGETGWFGAADSVYRGVTQRIPLSPPSR
jgi:DNA-binding NarL/FixJ family response regulator